MCNSSKNNFLHFFHHFFFIFTVFSLTSPGKNIFSCLEFLIFVFLFLSARTTTKNFSSDFTLYVGRPTTFCAFLTRFEITLRPNSLRDFFRSNFIFRFCCFTFNFADLYFTRDVTMQTCYKLLSRLCKYSFDFHCLKLICS